MKLRDFEYGITLSRIRSWSSDSVTVHVTLTHPDGEELHIYFYEDEPLGPDKLFWSTGGMDNSHYARLQELQSFYRRIYAVRIHHMLQE